MDRFGVLLLAIVVYIKPLFVFFILAAFCISECTDTTDPLDKMGDVDNYIVGVAEILDKDEYGFEVIYLSENPVTKARSHEMMSRKEFCDMTDSMSVKAVERFGRLEYVDIYDFAEFVKGFVMPGYRVFQIFVSGNTRSKFKEPNPDIENSSTRIIERNGILYLDEQHIHLRSKNEPRVYLYYKAKFPWDRSDTIQYFSHMTEEEMIRYR